MKKIRENTTDENLAIIKDGRIFPRIDFKPNDLVVDIGAHIGSFSEYCLRKGAGKVIAFEWDKTNFELAKENLADYGDRFEIYPYCPGEQGSLGKQLVIQKNYNIKKDGRIDTASKTITTIDSPETEMVPTIGLDQFIEQNDIKHIKFIHFRCGTCAWPIFMDSKYLGRIYQVYGKVQSVEKVIKFFPKFNHPKYGSKIDYFKDHFRKQGFAVNLELRDNPDIFLFSAWRG